MVKRRVQAFGFVRIRGRRRGHMSDSGVQANRRRVSSGFLRLAIFIDDACHVFRFYACTVGDAYRFGFASVRSATRVMFGFVPVQARRVSYVRLFYARSGRRVSYVRLFYARSGRRMSCVQHFCACTVGDACHVFGFFVPVRSATRVTC
ncbi:hypothetical protein AVEN_72529-1 [Araneus ventricosus]|uniref:Uncharacterized protein n=1 Tax=Araneus ventricosus TaxID=182803 RepID=A0A4Y2TUN4_ARAVE|nr:hypothetical protein AVEN_72529-1 [Araneus ventricosus]